MQSRLAAILAADMPDNDEGGLLLRGDLTPADAYFGPGKPSY